FHKLLASNCSSPIGGATLECSNFRTRGLRFYQFLQHVVNHLECYAINSPNTVLSMQRKDQRPSPFWRNSRSQCRFDFSCAPTLRGNNYLRNVILPGEDHL